MIAKLYCLKIISRQFCKKKKPEWLIKMKETLLHYLVNQDLLLRSTFDIICVSFLCISTILLDFIFEYSYIQVRDKNCGGHKCQIQFSDYSRLKSGIKNIPNNPLCFSLQWLQYKTCQNHHLT